MTQLLLQEHPERVEDLVLSHAGVIENRPAGRFARANQPAALQIPTGRPGLARRNLSGGGPAAMGEARRVTASLGNLFGLMPGR